MPSDNPLRLAQRQGIRAVNDLGVLFRRLGTNEHPNSQTLVAYRAANRALKDALKSGGGLNEVRDITRQLRIGVRAGIRPVLLAAVEQGYNNAARQLAIYKTTPPERPDLTLQVGSVYGLIDTTLQKQEAAVTALMLSGADEGLITGDDARQGVLRASEVVIAAAFWVASLWWDTFSQTAERADGSSRFSKQAVAALDWRTTDCCLRVHGQVQPLGVPFELTGTPRFADQIDWPPFHNWCRTSGVLYQAAYDDGLAERMQASAATVLAERAAGVFKDRHPADALI